MIKTYITSQILTPQTGIKNTNIAILVNTS